MTNRIVTILIAGLAGMLGACGQGGNWAEVAYPKPVADFDVVTVASLRAQRPIEFVSACKAEQSEIVAWEWDLGDGTRSGEESVEHTYGAEGSYAVTLTVTDNIGQTATATKRLSVGRPNALPTATIEKSMPDGPFPGKEVVLSASASDADGSVAWYRWDFGDGSPAVEGQDATHATHTFAKPGKYVIRLTVTDDTGDGAPHEAAALVFSPETRFRVSAGWLNTLAIRDDGVAYSWGHGTGELLGWRQPVPLPLVGVKDLVAISAGKYHSAGLRSDGTVWTWGVNNEGQAGNGQRTEAETPAQVPGLTDILQISADGYHTLALRADGTVWAWGDNAHGEIGDGTKDGPRTTPLQVVDLTDVVEVEAGEYHNLALLRDGTVRAWGDNQFGQLGSAETIPSDVVPVVGLTDVVAISAAASHSLALRRDGTVWGWGDNGKGQVGVGGDVNYRRPTQLFTIAGATAIAAGYDHSAALGADGSLWTWGDNKYGQLGNGTLEASAAPRRVEGVSGLTAIVASGFHNIAAGSDRGVWTWGLNEYFQMGNLSDVDRPEPTRPYYRDDPILSSLIAAGQDHSLALAQDGSLWAWGNGGSGTLGNRTVTLPTVFSTGPIPAPVEGIRGIRAMAGGQDHTVVLKEDGTVWSWGDNSWGQLGDPAAEGGATPVQALLGSAPVVAVAAADNVSVALDAAGVVWDWGGRGVLPPPVTMPPAAVPGLTDVVALTSTVWTSYALKGDGTVWGIGRPLWQVPGLTGVKKLAVGGNFFDFDYEHFLAIRADGTLWARGKNDWGQLGDGTTLERTEEVPVPGLTDVVAVAAGAAHSLALTSDGTVWSWGDNSRGQLGDSTFVDRASPAPVPGITGAVAVATGMMHSLALTADGTVWAWGNNGTGALGRGFAGAVYNLTNATPMPVARIEIGFSLAPSGGQGQPQ